FWIDRLEHLVLADHQMRLNRLIKFRCFELLACDAGQHDTVAPGKGQLASMWPRWLNQLGVALESVDHLNGAVAGLCEWALHHFQLPVRDDLPVLARSLLDRLQPPILGFENQYTPP